MSSYYVRAEVLSGFTQHCQSLGISGTAILQRVGLSPKLIADADLLLPYEAVTGAMEIASKLCGQADFSQGLTHYHQPYPIGVPRLLMRDAQSVRAAIQALIHHNHLHSQGVVWQLEEGAELAYMIREDKMAGKLPSFQYAQLSIAHAIIAVRTLIDQPHWLPQQLLFSYAEPRQPDPPQRILGARIQYNQERTAIAFEKDILNLSRSPAAPQPTLQTQAQIEQLRRHQQQRYPTSKPEGLVEIERWIRRHIHQDRCQLPELALELKQHPKKLQRYLMDQGLNFRRLKADIRLDMGEHYLLDSDLPLTIIATLLGFGDLSGFSRAFKHRHHCSPQIWRQQHTH